MIVNGETTELKTEYDELKDYKFFCFNGKVRFFKVDFGRFVEHHANYYSPEGELLEFGEQGLEPDSSYPIELPNNLKEMISLAEKLSANEPFLRVDFYNVNGKILFVIVQTLSHSEILFSIVVHFFAASLILNSTQNGIIRTSKGVHTMRWLIHSRRKANELRSAENDVSESLPSPIRSLRVASFVMSILTITGRTFYKLLQSYPHYRQFYATSLAQKNIIQI